MPNETPDKLTGDPAAKRHDWLGVLKTWPDCANDNGAALKS